MTGLPALADTRRSVPAHPGARHDAIEGALRSLEHEQRRFARLGFSGGVRRCAEARRFWSFVGALYSLAEGCDAPRGTREARGAGAR